MYDLSIDFKKFYYNEVVLSKDETTNLREKKKLNIDRLKNGLKKYNEENNTDYSIAETLEQGSVAMSTVTQNQKNDYDIDVAIVFDESNLNGLGAIAAKNMVVKALKEQCTSFKKEPEALTNCVRIVYSDNYHIDFAIYRRYRNEDGSYSYEHAGSEWRLRNPRAINNWFKDEIKEHGEQLRQVVRLSKMFCKSRDTWRMPGGLIQSVLCEEKIKNYDRMDEMFYYTMNSIKDRLGESIEISNPTDSTLSLLLKNSDRDKMNNLYTRIKDKLEKLNILFDNECTKKQAMEAWNEFFNHSYWIYDEEVEDRAYVLKESNFSLDIKEYDDTEESIYNIMPVRKSYNIKLDCKVINASGTMIKLSTLNNRGDKVPLNRKLEFYLDENRVPKPYKVYWKVKNEGYEAIKYNCIRGDIFESYGDTPEKMVEESSFGGEHYVECYIVKNNVCVAMDRIDVPISNI